MQDTFAATLHYQLAYRLQNHAFDMAVPDIAQSNDALLIQNWPYNDGENSTWPGLDRSDDSILI